jgi:hypothetical protein
LFWGKRAAAALAAAALAVGCGYGAAAVRDGAAATPVAVPLFDNRTFEPYLDARVTERVRTRVVNTGAWRLVSPPEAATVVIRGAVTGFSVVTVSFDADNRPLEQRVALTADVTAAQPQGTPFQQSLTATAEFRETADSLRTRTAKNRAIEEAADNLARELLARVHAHLLAQSGSAREPAPTPAAP